MLSVQPWIGIALLGISWLLGLDYYEMASPKAQAVVLILGAWMLAEGERANPVRRGWAPVYSREGAAGRREAYPELTLAILLLLLPVAWWTPWPYRLSPLAIIAGLVLERVLRGTPLLRVGRRLLRPIAAAWVMGGVILLAQAVVLSSYAAVTARNHDLPGVLVKPLAALCWLAGIDAAADGPLLVVQSARQSHRLAVSWDMVFDPATLMFLAGGLVWITIDTGRVNSIRPRWAEWGRSMGCFALIVAAWLPVRAIVLLGIYLHCAAVSEWNQPLHVMNQFLSPWVLLVMLVPPILLAWRWVRLLGDAPLPAAAAEEGPKPGLLRRSRRGAGAGPAAAKEDALRASKKSPSPPAPLPSCRVRQAGEGSRGVNPRPRAPIFQPDTSGSLSVKYLAAAACCLFGTILVALGLQWEPIGTRKAGRVKIVEKHSPWSPSNPEHPYDTEFIGGGDNEHGSSYNYAAAYRYLSQYYEMSCLNEEDAIDEKTLSACDVLVIKIPRFRFAPEEVRAIVDFVEAGGGLLLIGDHTNLDCSAAHMNDITRAFGFTFRDDVLYSNQPSPDQEHYQASTMSTWCPVPHPAIEHVPEFDFAVSCSIDPGISLGRPVVAAAGLWSMPGDYHMENYMPFAQHVPDMRFGSFIQAWSTHGGRGRVIAWGDSTIFSNFCLYQPGKAQVLLNLVEWLNHRGGTGVWWLWTMLGLAAMGNGLWLVRDDGSRAPCTHGRLVLVAAVACGWTVGSAATAALLAREMPLPVAEGDRRLPCVVIDRTTLQVPLAKGPDNDDRSGRGFGLLEQAIPRLGYTTVRAEGDGVFQGDAVVMICPSRPASEAFRKRLVEYVDGGGQAAGDRCGAERRAFDARTRSCGPSDCRWTTPRRGRVNWCSSSPGRGTRSTSPGKYFGGQRVATLNGERAVCAIVPFGKGQVMVVSFGNMFNDKNLGNDWSHNPDPAERDCATMCSLRSCDGW